MPDGWLTGCEPSGSDCPSSSALAVEQIVARVNPNTTVRGAPHLLDSEVTDVLRRLAMRDVVVVGDAERALAT